MTMMVVKAIITIIMAALLQTLTWLWLEQTRRQTKSYFQIRHQLLILIQNPFQFLSKLIKGFINRVKPVSNVYTNNELMQLTVQTDSFLCYLYLFFVLKNSK